MKNSMTVAGKSCLCIVLALNLGQGVSKALNDKKP
jgi:hypothetical protein